MAEAAETLGLSERQAVAASGPSLRTRRAGRAGPRQSGPTVGAAARGLAAGAGHRASPDDLYRRQRQPPRRAPRRARRDPLCRPSLQRILRAAGVGSSSARSMTQRAWSRPPPSATRRMPPPTLRSWGPSSSATACPERSTTIATAPSPRPRRGRPSPRRRTSSARSGGPRGARDRLDRRPLALGRPRPRAGSTAMGGVPGSPRGGSDEGVGCPDVRHGGDLRRAPHEARASAVQRLRSRAWSGWPSRRTHHPPSEREPLTRGETGPGLRT